MPKEVVGVKCAQCRLILDKEASYIWVKNVEITENPVKPIKGKNIPTAYILHKDVAICCNACLEKFVSISGY